MTVREKLESFESIEDLLDYLDNLGIDTNMFRILHFENKDNLIDNILLENRYTDRIQVDINRENWFNSLGI